MMAKILLWSLSSVCDVKKTVKDKEAGLECDLCHYWFDISKCEDMYMYKIMKKFEEAVRIGKAECY